MPSWTWIALVVGVLGAIAVAILFLFISFVRYPLQNAIRAMISLLIAMVAHSRVPTIKGSIDITMDWGWILKLDGKSLAVVNGDPTADYAIAFICTSLLLGICFLRVPPKPS